MQTAFTQHHGVFKVDSQSASCFPGQVEWSLELQLPPEAIAVVHLEDGLDQYGPGHGLSLGRGDILRQLSLVQLHCQGVAIRVGVLCGCGCECVCVCVCVCVLGRECGV